MENQQVLSQLAIDNQLAVLRLKRSMLSNESKQLIAEIVQEREVEICNAKNDYATKRMTLKNKRFEIEQRQHEFYLQGDENKCEKMKLQRLEVDKQLSLLQDQLQLEICAIRRKSLERQNNVLQQQRKQVNEYEKKKLELKEQLEKVIESKTINAE